MLAVNAVDTVVTRTQLLTLSKYKQRSEVFISLTKNKKVKQRLCKPTSMAREGKGMQTTPIVSLTQDHGFEAFAGEQSGEGVSRVLAVNTTILLLSSRASLS